MMIAVTDWMMIGAWTGTEIEIVIGTNGIGAMGERDHIRGLYHPDPDSRCTEPRGARGALNGRTSEGGEIDESAPLTHQRCVSCL